MKFSIKVLASSALIASLFVVVPNEGAVASFKATAPATASDKAGLATCATLNKIISVANTFSNRKKSKDAAANKAAAAAILGSLRSDFGVMQSELNAALHLDSSFHSWQAPVSVIESFNGNNGAAVGAAVVTLMGYCLKLHK